jgi:hypothetical protein
VLDVEYGNPTVLHKSRNWLAVFWEIEVNWGTLVLQRWLRLRLVFYVERTHRNSVNGAKRPWGTSSLAGKQAAKILVRCQHWLFKTEWQPSRVTSPQNGEDPLCARFVRDF